MARWTAQDLRAYEIRQKQRDAECARSSPVLEPDSSNDAVGSAPIQEANHERIVVRVCSVRKRLLDEDNLCEKYLVDSLRYCGLIPNDCPGKVKIEVSQRRCLDGETEQVLISIL